MKTIAISIDETTLERVDEVVAKSPRLPNRSAVIRLAVREFADRELQRREEERERTILNKHRKRLERQARALVRAQGSA
jgi:metal-responsive CopG/Arc/MetJ family transcriptional regulator